ncbi:4737_t:CDS:1 [Funneliformis geosporum]|uniref:2069_t:CDS:1 n=1 Tax=Funneliformis geosporum TaxID=1117311 RepID=A0A9W4SPT1_9GLOM|nr:4737_t:CDS:1 [Funneliformis geosporum]CAI2176418.1 2069_t:CDS:1 [Funneliformis geosporum]
MNLKRGDGDKPVSIKSSNSAKKRDEYPLPHHTTPSLTNEGFDSVTVTLLPTTYSNDNKSIQENFSNLRIPILACLIATLSLIIIAMVFGFYIKRRNKTFAIAIKKGFHNNASHISAIISESIIDERIEIQEINSESPRSSTSSILIEVMTDTLSNIIKNQGGKIEIPSNNNSNVSARPELIRVKSLDYSNNEDYNSKNGNDLASSIKNIFGKRRSILKNTTSV